MNRSTLESEGSWIGEQLATFGGLSVCRLGGSKLKGRGIEKELATFEVHLDQTEKGSKDM